MEQNVNTEQPASTPPATTVPANESNFAVEDTPIDNIHNIEDNIDKDKDIDNKVEDAQDQDRAPSGKATSALEIKDSKDTSPTNKGKETMTNFSSSLAIDTSSIAKGNLSHFFISFDKPYQKMSPTEKILAAAALQAQATQELAQEESKDRELIKHSFEPVGT